MKFIVPLVVLLAAQPAFAKGPCKRVKSMVDPLTGAQTTSMTATGGMFGLSQDNSADNFQLRTLTWATSTDSTAADLYISKIGITKTPIPEATPITFRLADGRSFQLPTTRMVTPQHRVDANAGFTDITLPFIVDKTTLEFLSTSPLAAVGVSMPDTQSWLLVPAGGKRVQSMANCALSLTE